MGVRITGGDKLRRFLRDAGKGSIGSVEIGFYGSARYPPTRKMGKRTVRVKRPPFVVEVAAWNEFGTRPQRGAPTPARPFMQPALVASRRDVLRILKEHVNPKTLVVSKGIGDLIGLTVQAQMRETMTALKTPPNAPATIALKGSSNPLIDVGTLRRSVTWRVLK